LQVFPRGSNAVATAFLILLAGGIIAAILLAIILTSSHYAYDQNLTVEQPVPFSHKHHVSDDGIDCRYCHTSVMVSHFAGVPATHVCMTCHSQLWTNAEMLAPVRESLKKNEPLRWQRVTSLPDYVYFNHSVHVQNGVGCESCHGRVDRMPLTEKRKPLTMQFCLACHTNPAPQLRPPDEITTMGYEPAADALSGQELMAHYDIDTTGMTDCATCHR